MTLLDPELAKVARDAAWLPHRYDPDHDAVHFVHAPRETHRAATFLIDEHLPTSANPVVIKRGDALAANDSTAPIHFIFHSAFCGSTLLARAFDVEGRAMGLKEPVVLNDLVGWRLRGGNPRDVAAVLDGMLTLLARPFELGEATVVKPSCILNGLASAMLALRPNARAVLMYAPLPTYLGSIARKGMWGRLWVRDLLMKQLREQLIDLGFTPEDHLLQTDLQVAAVGWLAQHIVFAKLIERFGPERVRVLDSETLVTRPADTLTVLDQLYGTGLGDERIAAIAEGPVFKRHSKLGDAFSSADRAADLERAAAVHGDEIEKVTKWAETVAANVGVSLELTAPLLPAD